MKRQGSSRGLIGNKNLPADVMAEIVERTDGIPLFVEEMTKAVLEAESEGAARRTAAAVPSSALAVPASLHRRRRWRGSIGWARPGEVAQIGSAIGREFSCMRCWRRWRGSPRRSSASALDRLFQAGLLFRQGVPPLASYLFKQAASSRMLPMALLREPRRALSTPASPKPWKADSPRPPRASPRFLAHHYTEAGRTEAAIEQ